jgi:hypothetical protein
MKVKNKKNINSYIEFKIKNQTDTVKGFLLDYSEEWTLLYNNPVDYVIDGYLLIKNNQITNHLIHPSTDLKSTIFRKKQEMMNKPKKLKIENSTELFQNLFEKEIVLSISNFKKNFYLIGRIKSRTDTKLDFEQINPKAKWRGEKKINIDEISLIEFDTDYINSLLLVAL